MKKYYRNRIMLSAMLSFLIILVIAVAGIWLFSYQRIERDTDSFIASRLEPREEGGGRRARFSQDAPPAMFGYTPGRRTTPSGFYEITFTAEGEAETVNKRGIAEDAGTVVQEYVMDAVKAGAEKGKVGYTFSGDASFYGKGYDGRKTASGEIFDRDDFTCAHRTLPFGTKLKVVRDKTGASVVVRVNDRGPYSKKRVLDLSEAAGKALGLEKAGHAQVTVTVIE